MSKCIWFIGHEASIKLNFSIRAENAYINTAHPDFLSGHKALAIVGEKLATSQSQVAKPGTPGHGDNRRMLPSAPASSSTNTAASMSATGTSGSQAMNSLPGTSLYPVATDSENLYGSFMQKKTPKKPGVLEPPPPILKATGSLSEREYVEIEVISRQKTVAHTHTYMPNLDVAMCRIRACAQHLYFWRFFG